MAVAEFEPKELRNIRKHFGRYGTIKVCAENTKLHPGTISRAIKTGIAEEGTILKIREYMIDEVIGKKLFPSQPAA